MAAPSTTLQLSCHIYYTSTLLGFSHLAEFLSFRVGQECFQGLEAGVDALHAAAFVAVGDLSSDSSLLVLGCLGAEGDVGQAEEDKGETIVDTFAAVNVEAKTSLTTADTDTVDII